MGRAADWISANLCDGEDEKSEQLERALKELDDEGERQRRLRIRAQVENMVHSLLRVRDLSSRMMEMFDTSASDQKKDGAGSDQGGEDVGEQRSDP